jgi:branched-subunit amino acid transport protein
MDLAILIAGMAAVTYPMRAVPLLLGGHAGRLPSWMMRWLAFLPIALFTAVAASPIVTPALAASAPLAHPYPWAALTAALLARRTGNLTLAMLASMAVVLVWRLALG